MTQRIQLHLAHLNLTEALREVARWRDGTSILEEDDLVLVAGRDSFPVGYFNAAIRTGARAHADDDIERASAFFGAKGRGYTLWVRDGLDSDLEDAALARGFENQAEVPGMLVTTRPDDPSPLKGVDVRWAEDEQTVQDFVSIAAEAYVAVHLPAEVTAVAFGEPGRLLVPHVKIVVASVDGTPAAAALVLLSHGTAGVYWVGTREAHRGRGLGDLCTRLVTQAGFDAGANGVCLQATPQGHDVYQRIGYRDVTTYRWYTPPEV